MKNWYKIKAAADRAEVLIYDEIGIWGITAQDFVRDLKQIDAKAIDLRINSPGGSVFDGIAIYNALRAHPANVTTHVDGVAASIASVIALAGDTVSIAENAFFMVHHPWTVAIGNKDDLLKAAADLEKIGGSLVDTYQRKTKKEEKMVLEWMDNETWFTAEEAVEVGLADEIVEQEMDAAAFALGSLKIPEKYSIRQVADHRAYMERRLRLAAV